MVKHHASSARWLKRQEKDPYVKQAQQSHYRSRAVYKLKEIDKKDRLFRKGQTVIDLGAAPGSWSQYASEQLGQQGKVIAIDILPMEPIDNVLFIKGDFTEQAIYEECLQVVNSHSVDLVISDMAPNLSGIKATDQARSIYLAELSRDLAFQVLKPDGRLLIKVFQGEGNDEFKQSLAEHFQKIMTRKPEASRKNSREFYVLASAFTL
jgi:23S rRNA (uridine2552-2'-O)-methyltransferase